MTTNSLPVNEIFESFQGESSFTGTPAVFVRLQGCPVGCPWCDTRHSWVTDPDKVITKDAMLRKEKDAPTYARLASDALAEIIGGFQARHVVITGGEPCLHDLTDLTDRVLWHLGRSVQVETSGTSEIRVADKTWVTLSPKIGMPGGLSVRDDALLRADEIKMPVGKLDDVEKLLALLARRPASARRAAVWLQPLSRSEKATELCLREATKRGWRLSVQTHAFVGVR